MDWIKVSDRLPEPGQWVLISRYGGRVPHVEVGSYRLPREGGWAKYPYWMSSDDNIGDMADVTHWMPLPAAPREQDQPTSYWVERDGYTEMVCGRPHPTDRVLSSHLSPEAAWEYRYPREEK